MYSSSSLTRLSAASCGKKDKIKHLLVNYTKEKNVWEFPVSRTYSNILVGGLSATEVVLGEELGQLRLDATKRLVLAVKKHHQVWHGERLAHQHQQLAEKPCEPRQK